MTKFAGGPVPKGFSCRHHKGRLIGFYFRGFGLFVRVHYRFASFRKYMQYQKRFVFIVLPESKFF